MTWDSIAGRRTGLRELSCVHDRGLISRDLSSNIKVELTFQAWQGQRDSWGGNPEFRTERGKLKFLVLLQWSTYIIVLDMEYRPDPLFESEFLKNVLCTSQYFQNKCYFSMQLTTSWIHPKKVLTTIWGKWKTFVIKFFLSWVSLSAHAGEIHTVLNNLWSAAWVTSEHDTRILSSLGSFMSWQLLTLEKDSLNENCTHTYDSKSRCVFSYASFSWQNPVLGQVQWANLLKTWPCKRTTIWDWPQNLQQIPFSWEWSLWWRQTFSTNILLD